MKTRSFTPSKHTMSLPVNSDSLEEVVRGVFGMGDCKKSYMWKVRARTHGQCAICGTALTADYTDVLIPNGEHLGPGEFSCSDVESVDLDIQWNSFCVCPCCIANIRKHDTHNNVHSIIGERVRAHIIPYRVIHFYVTSDAPAFYAQSRVSGLVGYGPASTLAAVGALDRDWDRGDWSTSGRMRHSAVVMSVGYTLCRAIKDGRGCSYYDVDTFIAVDTDLLEQGKECHIPTCPSPKVSPAIQVAI
jgi:hypothetical protein